MYISLPRWKQKTQTDSKTMLHTRIALRARQLLCCGIDSSLQQFGSQGHRQRADLSEEDPTASFIGLNALEVAAIANAKKFLSQRIVQKIVNDIWSGHIVFWESLSVHSKKKAQVYNQR